MNMMNPSMKIDNSLVKHGKKYQAKPTTQYGYVIV